MQLSAWVTLYPHHEHITAQSAQELGILEGQKGSRFIHSRRGSKYFISWLCGFVASIRVSLSEGCRPCYPVALLVAPAGTLEMSVIWKKGTWGFSSPQKETWHLQPRDQLRLLLALFHMTWNHPTFFTLLQGSTEARASVWCPQTLVQPCVRKRHKSSLQRIVEGSDNWQQQAHLVAWCHV